MKAKIIWEIGSIFEYIGLKLMASTGDGWARGRLISIGRFSDNWLGWLPRKQGK